MFLWLKFDFSTHPLGRKIPHASLSRALWVLWTHKPYLVLVSPGTIFCPTKEIAEAKGYAYFRLCFAACDENVLADISTRFVEGIQAFWRIKDEGKIKDLLDEGSMGVVSEDVTGMGGPC